MAQDGNPYPERDEAQEILDATPNVSNRVRATAWDAFYQARDEAGFQKAIDALPLPQETKARLWDAKFGEGRRPLTTGEQLWEGAKGLERTANPLRMIHSAGRALIPEVVGNALGMNEDPSQVKTGPLNALQADMGARNTIYNTARNPVETAAAFVPFFGPALLNAGTDMAEGRWGEGLGETLGIGAATFGPTAAARASVRVPAVARNHNPVEQAAVQFGESQGIPIDAATATGSRFTRIAQKRASESLGGAGTAEAFKANQADALARVGGGLAERANLTRTGRPGRPADQISAGEAVQGRLESRINAQNRIATNAYDALRALEQQAQATINRTGGVKAPETAARPFTDVPLAVDVAAAKSSLRPLYESLKREKDMVGVLQGGKARTLVALDNLMNGPDMAPLSVVDAALGDLKAMSRTKDLPALRTQGQATAAQAVKALEEQVTATARNAGPDVYGALQRGRQATIGKYETASVRESLSGEPAQVFRQLTANKDVGLERLRAVAQQTPREVPKIARAYLEQLVEKATREGGFGHADALWADWQRLGPETKAILFKDRALIKDLDNFFLLAKKVGENPNPSGTAATLTATNVVSAPLTYALAKMLYSRAGVRALTQGFTARLGRRGRATATAGTIGELERIAREFGALEPAPAMAEERPPEEAR